MRTSRFNPSLNAGSMADIAFLLLIFFLVATTIPNDKGIARKLPAKCPPDTDCNIPLSERNVLRILLDAKGRLLVDDSLTSISVLKKLLIDFIDNNGDGSCTYCEGEQLVSSSDNPGEAVISLSADRLTPYADYIRLQDEIAKAYAILRENYIQKKFNKNSKLLTKEEQNEVRIAYPLIISEAEIK